MNNYRARRVAKTVFLSNACLRLSNVCRISCEPLFRLAAAGAARCLPRLKKFSAGVMCWQRDAAPVLFDRAASAAGAERRLGSFLQKLCGQTRKESRLGAARARKPCMTRSGRGRRPAETERLEFLAHGTRKSVYRACCTCHGASGGRAGRATIIVPVALAWSVKPPSVGASRINRCPAYTVWPVRTTSVASAASRFSGSLRPERRAACHD